jgi:hypothetical protein
MRADDGAEAVVYVDPAGKLRTLQA